MITQKRKINLIPANEIVVIPVSQFDTGEDRLVFDLYKDNETYTPSGTAVIQGTCPDGSTFTHSVTLSGYTVTSDLYADMTAVAGQVRAQIVVTEGDDRTGSQVFFLSVQQDSEGEL